jgi:hypothetical protein
LGLTGAVCAAPRHNVLTPTPTRSDLAVVNAEGAVRLPRPTLLVVDPDRVVRFVDVQPDYTARTEVADIIAGQRPVVPSID